MQRRDEPMVVNIPRIRPFLQNFDFKILFVEELGWDFSIPPLAMD